MVGGRGALQQQGEGEGGPFAGAAIGPDAPAVALDDAPAQGQANARALEVLRAVQALKDAEQRRSARAASTTPLSRTQNTVSGAPSGPGRRSAPMAMMAGRRGGQA